MILREIYKNIMMLLFVTILISLVPKQTLSQDMAVPAKLQAALFKKIFSFDNTLKSKGIDIAILTTDGSGGEVESNFKAAGLKVSVVTGNSVPSGATVAYVMPGVSSPKSECASKKVLSVSGVTSYVESGDVAIGLGVEGGKPKIIIHHNQLMAEGHEIAGGLLNIAKVIK